MVKNISIFVTLKTNYNSILIITNMTKTEILERLKAGNEQFVKDNLSHNNIDKSARKELVNGQNPFAIVLSCADSRVIPELIFDTGLGELFVLRVAGNIANTSTIASIEYSVAHLNTEMIVVLGHQACGAVTAAVNGGDNGYNLNHLLAHIVPAMEATADNATVDDVIHKNAELTVKELTKRSGILSDAVNSGKLQIVPAYYHLDSGKVDFL